jgi:hypothetical protein
MFENFNGFKVALFMVSGLSQWAIIIAGFVFFIKMIVVFSGFNVAMLFLCIVSFFLTVILHPIFQLCAIGREMEINEHRNLENQ